MKVLIFLCFFLPQVTSNVFNGINYHYVNESAPRKPDNNMTYCEYMYDDKDEWKPILMITDEKTVPRKIGFNCGDYRKECCSLGCCITSYYEMVESLKDFGWFLLRSLGFMVACFAVTFLICWLIDSNPKSRAFIKNLFPKITPPPPRKADRVKTKKDVLLTAEANV